MEFIDVKDTHCIRVSKIEQMAKDVEKKQLVFGFTLDPQLCELSSILHVDFDTLEELTKEYNRLSDILCSL